MSSGTRSIRLCLFVIVVLILTSLGGCRKLKNMFGIGDSVVDPEPGTAEAVVRDLLAAGTNQNREQGWEDFQRLLHTQELGSRGAMSACQRTYWPGFRRKAEFFVTDPAKLEYEILEDRPGETDNYRKIFIRNVASDQATPIPLKRDPGHQDAWRLAACSL